MLIGRCAGPFGFFDLRHKKILPGEIILLYCYYCTVHSCNTKHMHTLPGRGGLFFLTKKEPKTVTRRERVVCITTPGTLGNKIVEN